MLLLYSIGNQGLIATRNVRFALSLAWNAKRPNAKSDHFSHNVDARVIRCTPSSSTYLLHHYISDEVHGLHRAARPRKAGGLWLRWMADMHIAGWECYTLTQCGFVRPSNAWVKYLCKCVCGSLIEVFAASKEQEFVILVY